MCQPTGRLPVTAFIAATVRAMRSRSSASSRSAWPSQRQPCAETSWPRRTASCASSGSRSTARPLELTVAGAPCWPSTSMIRHQPAREPYSKWLSIAGSGRPARRCSISYTASFSASPSVIENSAPSSKLTTMRHRHPGAAGPVRIGRRAGISEQIAGSGPCLAEIAAFDIPRSAPDGLSPTGGRKRHRRGQSGRTTAVSLPCSSMPLFLPRRRTRKAQEPGR